MENTIKITRKIDGLTVTAHAFFVEDAGFWKCSVCDGDANGPIVDQRDESSDVWLELYDMIDLALDTKRQELARNAGPFSNAQCE